jgi:TonB family protein
MWILCRFVLLCALASAPSFADDAQARGQVLLDRALQLSDIRAANSPAFRLKASFSFVGRSLESNEGTYTELWESHAQWRRELVFKDLHRVEVSKGKQRWLLEPNYFPDAVARVPGLLQIPPFGFSKAEFASIKDNSEGGVKVECAISKPGFKGATSAFCFEEKSGLILESAFPEFRLIQTAEGFRIFEHTCSYGTFRKLGNYWFPHEVVCVEDGHREIGIKVTEIELESHPDLAQFIAPEGAIELSNCEAGLVAPKAVSVPPAYLAAGSSDHSHVEVSLVVDRKGIPQNVKVVASGSKKLDADALDNVRHWRFKPATCDGEPVPSQLRVRVDFHFFKHF